MNSLSQVVMDWLKSQLGLTGIERKLKSINAKLEELLQHTFAESTSLKEQLIMLRAEFSSKIELLSVALKKGLNAEAENAQLLVKVKGLEEAFASATGTIEAFKAENAAEIEALGLLLGQPVSPVGDEVGKAVEESEAIPTPPVVIEEMPKIEDPAVPTPIEASEAAIDALTESAE